jgi:hypothetical protein
MHPEAKKSGSGVFLSLVFSLMLVTIWTPLLITMLKLHGYLSKEVESAVTGLMYVL